jgi:anti-sigma factor RsiW
MTSDELTCQDVIGLLLEYLEESLTPEVLAVFERHLASCPACLAYLRTYQKTRELAGEATRVAMPEEMKTRLRAFLLERVTRGA